MRRAPTPLVGIVADDLTGAMDASGAFAAHGLTARVMPSPSVSPPETGSNHVLCYNTQTRDADSAAVSQTVRKTTGLLLQQGCARLYKKIDSTLRGHVGLEILATLDASGAHTAFVCPAFPAMGRTVRTGVVFAGDKPVARDRDTHSVVDLLEGQTGHGVGLVTLTDVEWGEGGIEGRVENLLAQDYRIVVLDAVNDRHLENIATALENNHSEELVVGSAGLAYAVAAGMMKRGIGVVEKHPHRFPSGPFLLVSGSLSPVTQAQLRLAKQMDRLSLVPIDVAALLHSSSSAAGERARIMDAARDAFARVDDVGLTWSDPDRVLASVTSPVRGRETAACLAAFLQSVTSSLVTETPMSGLILVGGETAYSVLAGLRTEGIELKDEIAPGIPMGILSGGKAGGRFVITKAGGFGDDSALATVIRHARSSGSGKSAPP